MSKATELAEKLAKLNIADMYENDFFLTWEKTDDEIEAVFAVADALRDLRERNKSTKIFDSGLGISIFRDNSTRTRFSFASACNLLGLEVADLDEKKSQIAHGETVRETATMISFMADVIGIRDDMYIGKGNAYMHEFMDSVTQAHEDGELEQKPTLVNLQCDIDHPTQAMADALHIIHEFGGVENLKGKKIAMSWAYSPSYGKPLSVPQGIIGLLTRFGMDVVLAHPEGYEVMGDVVEVAKKNAAEAGGKFSITNDMKEAFKDADVVYPKSWAPFAAMEVRTDLYGKGDFDGIDKLEKELLEIPSRIDHQNDLISKCEDDIGYCTEWRKANPPVTENKLKKEAAQKRKDLRETIGNAVRNNILQTTENPLMVYRGFAIVLPTNMTSERPHVWLVRSGRYPVELGDTDTGNLIRIDNALDTLDEHLEKLKNGLQMFKKRQSDIKSELEKDEGYADKIEYYRNKVDELDEKLGAKEK